jgi:hypothetical protein
VHELDQARLQGNLYFLRLILNRPPRTRPGQTSSDLRIATRSTSGYQVPTRPCARGRTDIEPTSRASPQLERHPSQRILFVTTRAAPVEHAKAQYGA